MEGLPEHRRTPQNTTGQSKITTGEQEIPRNHRMTVLSEGVYA